MSDSAAAKEAFNMYDRDGSGKIPVSELGNCVRALGAKPTEKDLSDAANSLIRKNNFDVNDLLKVVDHFKRNPSVTDEMVSEAFGVFDRDGAGVISAAELRHVLTHLGERLTDAEADEMIQEFASAADGQIVADEFVAKVCE